MWSWNESRRWHKHKQMSLAVSFSSPHCVSITCLTFVTLASLTAPSCLCARAADWKLDSPDWTGRMRLTARGKVAYVKLEDKISGERETARRRDGQTDRQTGQCHCLLCCCKSCHCIVSSSTPSLVLICSKVTQPLSKQAGYFEAQRLIIIIR